MENIDILPPKLDWCLIEPLLEKLENAIEYEYEGIPKEWKGVCGVYVFLEESRAIYVGRGRNLYERIKQHGRSSVKDAPLAKSIAKKQCGIQTNYQKGYSKKVLASAEYQNALSESKERVRKMKVKGILIPDDPKGCISAILEIVTAVKLNTPYNNFMTT